MSFGFAASCVICATSIGRCASRRFRRSASGGKLIGEAATCGEIVLGARTFSACPTQRREIFGVVMGGYCGLSGRDGGGLLVELGDTGLQFGQLGPHGLAGVNSLLQFGARR